MYWSQIVPALVLATALLTVPGLGLGAVLGLRGLPLLSRSPLLSVGMIGAGAIALSALGVGFAPWSLLVTCAVLVLAAVPVRLLLRRTTRRVEPPERDGAGTYAVLGAALVAAALSIFLRIKQGIINPDALAQLTDVIFHLNAVHYILETGDGSTLTLGASVSPSGSPSLYPAAWHDLHALVHALAGGEIVATANATVIAVSAVAWPLSLLSLARALPRGDRSVHVAAGIVLCGSLTLAFPSLLLSWGVLYPTLLGLALVPAVMAVAIDLMRAVEERSAGPIVLASLQLLVGAAALLLAQPSMLVAAAVLLLPFLVQSGSGQLRRGRAARHALIFTCLVLLAVASGWVVLRPAREQWWERGVLGYGETWGPTLQTAHAVGDFVTSALGYDPVFWLFALLTWVGAWAAWRTPSLRWLVVSWLLSGFLWMVASAWDFSLVRVILVGPWYNDQFRVAAITAIPAAVLGGIGAGTLAQRLEKLVRRLLPEGHEGPARPIVAVVLVAGLFLAGGSAPVRDAWGKVSEDYAVHDHSLLLTEDEFDVLRHVDEYVPPSDVILVNPWEGGALAYSMVDREVSSRHVGGIGAPYVPLVQGIDDPAQQEQVCLIAQETGARWYLDFVNGADLGGAENARYAPLEEAVEDGVMTPVYVDGDVGLYRLDAC